MNIFLPYENNIEKSVESLDNSRLVKQILECKVLLDGAIDFSYGKKPNSYFKHPVAQWYKDYPEFLAYYGCLCCQEYFYRTNKVHTYFEYFLHNEIWQICPDEEGFVEPKFVAYYMEGSLGQLNYIRTTENVSKLFQNKLIKKWESDIEKGRPPKWTNRKIPEFYKNKKKEKKDDNI